MRKMFLLSVFMIVVLAACSAPQPTTTPTLPPPTLTPVPPTPTPIPPTPTAALQIEGGELDLAIIGASNLWGVTPLYAAFVENDLGVQVNAHDRTSGGLSIATILDRLRTNSSWRSDVAENEIVILFGGPDGSKSTAHPGDWDCGNRPYHVNDCSPETFDVFREHWSGAIEEIIALRGGKSTLIIATDLYNPFISGWRADGMEDTCRRCWDNMNATIREVAAERGVTFVSCYDVLNGPNHDEDPRVKGYIGADGIHCNALGQQVIADTLRTAGYGSTIPRP